ncbi:MAG: hypothetical protein ACKO4A_01610 [Gammaproteobacteria bacterium]
MPTTSLKLPEKLKQRVVAAAEKQGMSAHAFMVRAIDQASLAVEQRARFVADALAAREEAISSAKGFDADEVHAYLKARAGGKRPAVPKAATWRD